MRRVMPLQLTRSLTVPDDAVALSFVRSPGPGGQNVNKVATAAQLRFAIDRAQLPDEVASRLRQQQRNRITREGELVISAHRFRSQQRNRDDAFARLSAMLERASIRPKPQIKTPVPAGAKRRRRVDKDKRSRVKRLRGPAGRED